MQIAITDLSGLIANSNAPLQNMQSKYTSNGLEVSMYWHVSGANATLKAHVKTDHYTRHDTLSEAETTHIIRTAQDFEGYARIYWGMIL